MGVWIKCFPNEVTEIGTDEAITKGTASWSKGRLDGMTGCHLHGFMCSVFIHIEETNWHQFDRYEVPLVVGSHKGRHIIRTIQAEIKPIHVGGVFNCDFQGVFHERKSFRFSNAPSETKESILIEKEYIGKWFTVTIDFRGNIKYCFTKQGKYQ